MLQSLSAAQSVNFGKTSENTQSSRFYCLRLHVDGLAANRQTLQNGKFQPSCAGIFVDRVPGIC